MKQVGQPAAARSARRARRVAAVIGDPVRHSRSPAVHNAAFAAVGLDWQFVAFEVPAGAGAAALDAMRVLGMVGMSVTMPLKSEVATAADTADEAVQALGAANCIVARDDGSLHACNTDIKGFLDGLHADSGIGVQGKRIALFGGGGAARAVAYAVGAAGACDVAVINRTTERAEVAAGLAGAVGRVGTHGDIAAADIVVNATSIGMGADRSMPCDPNLIGSSQVAADLIYEPLETEWLRQLSLKGVQAYNGLSMLVYQAAYAFELWTGKKAPIDVMKRAVLS